MIYISCALYIEAAALISHYNLKKDCSYNTYQVFRGEQSTVIVTGSGMMPSAITITDFFARNGSLSDDIFINYGSCGGCNTAIGNTYLINHITDSTTGRTYVPDILIRHELTEGRLVTSPVPVLEGSKSNCVLYDMESSALYQCAIKHFQTHRIFFVKIVSDIIGKMPNRNLLHDIMDSALYRITGFIETLINYHPESCSDISVSDKVMIDSLSLRLRLTKTQQSELLCYFRFYTSEGYSVSTYINQFTNKHQDMKIKNKSEGKKYYELITRELLQ